MNESNINEEHHFGFLIQSVARLITRAYSSMMEPLGLTGPQSRVIAYVDRDPGITQADLSESLGLSGMAITGIIDRMEFKNLVRRVEDPTDRRVKRIYLTHDALMLKPDMEETIRKLRTQAGLNVSNEELATFVDVLERIELNFLTLNKKIESPRSKAGLR